MAAPPDLGEMAGGDPERGKNKRTSLQEALATDMSEWQGIQQLAPEVRENLESLQRSLPLAPFSPNQPLNVRANDPTGDLANETQSEVSIAAWNQYVVVTWFDSKNYISSFKGVGYAYSCDYGQTFVDGGGPPELDPSDMYLQPVVIVDSQGNFYMAANYGPNGFAQDTHAVWRGTWNGCVFTWAPPVLATIIDVPQVNAGDSLVRPRIAVSPLGPLFLTYEYNQANGLTRIEVVVSQDQGATWSAPVVLQQGGHAFRPDVSVGSDGLACVAYDDEYRAFIFCDMSGVDVPSHVGFCKSLDYQGTSWTSPQLIAERSVTRMMSGPGDSRGWDFSSVALKVDPQNPSYVGITWHESADWTAPTQSGNTIAESEPNDVPAQALPLPPGDAATGAMTALGQRDYWKVTLNAGDNYIARLDPTDFVCGTSGTTNGFILALYADAANLNVHPPDTLLARSFPSSFCSQIVFTAHKTGNYYLRVQQGAGVATGYTLRTGLVDFTRVSASRPARDFSDIVEIYSADGGSTWSQKILVNADAPVGYYDAYPSITVDNTSKVRIFWYDRRQTQNVSVNTAQLTDRYMAEGPWGSFGPGLRISDVSTTNSGLSRVTIAPGEYQDAWSDGGHVYAAWSDQRNSATTSHYDAYTQFLDFEPPATQFEEGPAEGSYILTSSTSFEWAATDRNPLNTSLQYSYSLDSAAYSAFTADTTTSLFDLQSGAHTFRVRSMDTAGNIESTATRHFFVDLLDPTVTITSGPGEGEAYLGSFVTFGWSYTDDFSGVQFAYEMDGGGFSAFLPISTITLPISSGSHTFVVQVRDPAGRTSSATRNFTSTPAVRWNQAASANWNSASNWDAGHVPTASDVVVIDQPSALLTITVNSAGMVASKLICRENLTISAGSLTLGSNSEISGTLTQSGTSTLSVTGDLAVMTLLWSGGTMSGAGTTTLDASNNQTFAVAARTLSGRILRNDGTLAWTVGNLTLSNNALFENYGTATAQHTVGNLTLGVGTGGGTFVNYGTFTKVGSSRTLNINTTFQNVGTLDIQAGTVNVNGSSFLNYSGTTLSGGTFSVAGTLNVGSRPIETNESTITLNGTGAILAIGTNALEGLTTNGSSGALTLNAGNNLTLGSASLTNSGTLAVGSLSTLDASNLSSYAQSGGSTIVNGTLVANFVDIQAGTFGGSGVVTAGAIQNGGTVSPGSSPGTLAFDSGGAFTQTASGHLAIEIGGATLGSFDRVSNTDAINLNGTLDVSLLNGFTPSAGQTFSILQAGLLSGDFTTFNLPTLPNGMVWEATPGAADYVLTVANGDTAAPAVTFTSGPQENQLVVGSGATFTWTALDVVTPRSSLLFAYRLDADPFTAFGPDTTATLSALSVGSHTFEVQAKDAVGNIGTAVRHFSFDTAVRWAVNANGDWNLGSNWSTGTVPTASDSVVIDLPGGPYEITVSTFGPVARAMSCAEKLILGNGQLLLLGSSEVSGTLYMEGGGLNITGDLTISGTLSWAGGTMEGSGTTRILSGTTSYMSNGIGSNRILKGRTLRNEGTLVWQDRDLDLQNGAAFQNQGTTNFALGNSSFSILTSSGTATVSNTGTFQKTSFPTTFSFGQSVNLSSVGAIDITVGTLNFQGTATISGPLNVDAGATLEASALVPLTLAGTSSVAGEIRVDSGATLNFSSGSHTFASGSTLSSAGTVQGTGAAISVAGNLDLANLSLSSGSFSLSHDDSIPTVDLSGGTLSVTGDLTLGSMSWSGGTMDGTGTTILSVPSNTPQWSGGSKYLVSRTIQNLASVSWTGGDIYLESGAVIDNQNLLTVDPPSTLLNLTTASTGVVTNSGTLSTKQARLLIVQPGITFTNSGTTSVELNGELRLNGTFTNFSAGTLSGGTYVVEGTLHFQDAAIQTNQATLELGGAGQIVDQNSANALAQFAANGSSGVLTLSGGRDLTTGASSLSNAGTVSIGNGSVLSAPSYVQSAGTTTVDGGATLEGSSSGVDIQGGTLGGNGAVLGNLNNGGTVSPGASPGTLSQSGGAYTQSSNGHLSLEIGGTQSSDLDHLVLSGNAALGGHLDASLVNGFTPSDGDTFPLIQYASSTGAFDQLNLPALPGNLTWQSVQGANQFMLVATETDTIPPVLAFTLAPSEGQTVLTSSVNFAWSATDNVSPSNAILYAYRLDGAPLTTFASVTSTLASASIGPHIFEVQAKDEHGNVSSVTRGFTIDVAVRWNVDANGDWNTASNWNTGTVPTSADSVVIDRAAGFYVITASSAANARALSCAESLAVTGGAFTLAEDSEISGSLAVSGTSTTFQVTGDLAVTGLMNWSSGTMLGTGTTTLAPGSTGRLSSASSKTLRERTLRNEGMLSWLDGGQVLLRDGAALENAGTMIENSTSLSTTLRRTNGTTGTVSFTNSGTFRKIGSSGSTTLGVNGDIDVTNSGAVHVESGGLRFKGRTTTVTGSVELDGGYVLFESGANTFAPGSVLRGNQPTLSQVIASGSSSSQPTTLSIAGELDIKFLWINQYVNCSLAHGDTLAHLLLSNDDSLSVAGDLLVTEDFDWYGGKISIPGTLRVASTGYLLLDTQGPRNLASGTLRSEGPVLLEFGETILNAGTTFESLDSLKVDPYWDYYPLYLPTISGAGTFKNFGVVHSPSTRMVTLSSVTENTGVIDFDAGSLTLGGPLYSPGTVRATGASVRLARGAQTFPPGSSIVGDSLFVTGANAVVNGPFDFNWASIDSGTFALDHPDTIPQLQVRGGSLSVSGDLRVGSLAWNGGEMTGTGTTTLAQGSHTFADSTGVARLLNGRTLRNEGTLTWSSNTTRVEGGGVLENAGILDYNGAGNDSLISLVIPGTFTNNGVLRTTGTGKLFLGGHLTATNADTFEVVSGALEVENFTNYSVDTNVLTGGVYDAHGTLVIWNADIASNAATLKLDGAAAQIQDQFGSNAIRNLTTNDTAGSLALSNGASFTTSGILTNRGTVTVGSGCTLGMDSNYEQTSGATTIDGGGTLDPNDTAYITGGTLSGSGSVAGDLNSAATVSPGASAGTLSVNAYTQQSAGALDVQIGGKPSSAFDRLVASGAASLAGTLNVSLIDGFTPALGDTFPFLPYASRTGTFDQVNAPLFSNDLTFDLVHTPNATTLVVAEKDTIPPNTLFVTGPANGSWVADDSVAVSWTGTDDHSPVGNITYATQLDAQPASAYSASTSLSLPGLAAGIHTFSVTAKDRVGNVDPTPAQISFYVDVIAPAADFTQSPAEQSVSDTSVAAFAWQGTDDQAPADSLIFTRSLDAAAYGPYSRETSVVLSGLSEGSHTFAVSVRDLAGNESSLPLGRHWKVDLNPPTVSFVGGPANGANINSTSVPIAWTAVDAVAPRDSLLFATSLDGAVFTSFTRDSTATLNLAEGSHTFSVQAKDQVGRVGTASRSFTIDITRPTVLLTQGPMNGGFAQNAVTLGWAGTDNLTPTGSLVFSYRLDLGSDSPYATQTSVNLTSLAPGAHTFEVKVRDLAGNESQTAATVTFTVDTIAPETDIVTGPVEGSTEDTSAVAFSWSGSDDRSPTDSLRYAFRVDAGTFGTFSSATTTTVTGLSDGSHTFYVKARDLAGNEDLSPASRSFIADVSAPLVTITEGPAANAYIPGTETNFAWTATDAVSPPESLQYAYKLDGVVSAWSPVGSAALSLLAEGPHLFEAKAKDLVGRVGTQSRNFVVDLTPPTVQAPTARTEDGFKVRFTFTGFDNFGLQGFEAEIASDPMFATVLFDSTLQGGSGIQLLYQGSPGNIYYARARALDRAGQLSPTSKVSNGAAIGNLPDLTVSDVQLPPTASSGQSFQVSWTVSNIGPASTNVPQWFDQIYLSPTATLNPGTATVLGSVQNLTFLSPSDSYTNQHVYTLPQGISGTQYVFVVADYQNQQAETNGSNNGLSDSFQVDLSSYADLVPIGIVDIGPTAFSGTQVTATWTVKNNGNGRTNVDNWYDTVFLSPDGNFDYTLPSAGQIKFLDQPLAQLQHVGALDPESTYTASINVTLPPQIQGTYHLFVWSDISVTQSNQTVAEMGNVFENVSEQNNYIGDEFDVVLTPPADLVVSSFTVPTSALSGQAVNLSWTVRNSGLNPTFESFWNDRVYMSNDNVLDAGDQVVLTLGHSGVLARDAEYTAAGTVILDPSLSGSRWFFVTTDYDLRAYELDDDNNSSAGSATTVELSPAPDLVVTDQIVEPTANAGSQLAVSWRVQNLGSGSLSGTWKERVYLSTSQNLNLGAATLLTTLSASAGTGELRTTTVDLSPSLGGVYYIHVLTDADNNVFEYTGEGNNTGAGSQVTVNAYPTVDLAVGNLVAPATLYSGNTYDVQWTVSNVDAGATPSPNSWGEALYLSTDALYSSGDVQVAGLTHNGSLASGASYTSHVSFHVADGFSGQYYLLVRITPSAVRDGNTTNDVVAGASAASFILTSPPDVTVTALEVTGSGVAAQPLHVVWTVANQGTGAPAVSTWDMGVYLSADPLLSSDDIALGSKSGPASLDPSSSYEDSLDVSTPNYVAGAYYLILQSDSQSELYEADESNNASYEPITMSLPTESDLRVSAVVAPLSASPAENVTVSWTIENVGANTAQGRIQDAVYVSKDATFNSIEDPLVGILERDINLAPGASLQAVKSVRLDEASISDVQGNILEELPGVTPGQYYFLVRTDIRENLRELDPSNNLGVSSSLTDVTVPELAIGSSVNTSVTASQSRYYRIPATAGLDLTVDVNSDQNDATNEIFLAYGRVPTLNDFDLAGPPEFTADPSILVPSTQSGDYYVLVRALALPLGSSSEALTLRARALTFSLSEISPDYGGTQGYVTCTLHGAGLRDTTQVFLEVSGIPTAADRITFLNTTALQVRWDLTQVPPGTYDVVAKNGSESVRLSSAFRVEAAEGLRVETATIHPDVIRDNSVAYFTFKFRNTANWDAPHLQGRLFYPADAELISLTSSSGLKKRSDLFPGTAAPIQGDFYAVEDTVVGSRLHVVDVLASDLPPGAELICTLGFRNFPGNPFSVRALTEVMDTETFIARQSVIIESARNALLQAPDGVPASVLALAGNPQAFRDTALVHTYVEAGLLEYADVTQFSLLSQPATAALLQSATESAHARFGPGFKPLAADDSCAALLPTPECVPDQGPLQTVLPDCAICLDASVPVTLRFPVEVTAPVLQGLCENLSGSATADARVVSPCDPNQITGPAGIGVPRWVASKSVIPYTVDFENLSEVASAPAQAVRVDIPLDADLNMSRFRLGNIGFGTHVVQVPPGTSSFTDEQFYADLGLRVRIVAGIDVTNHKAFWTFQSLDPATGLPPTNPYVGFLPVNDPFGRGQGFVSYSLEPVTGVVTGAQVTAQASIKFDLNPALTTNTATNTVDAGLPVSSLQAPTAIDPTTYRLQWTASDPSGGSGFSSVAVYVKQDNGPFTLFQSGLTGSSVLFDGIVGHVYGFYTLANDLSGNVEAAKTSPEVQVSIGMQGGIDDSPEKPIFRLLQNQPNPFAARTAIGFSLPEAVRVDLRVYDLAGRLVATLIDGQPLPAGPHRINFDASNLGSGIYFYRLLAGKNVTARKMVLIQ